MKTKILLKHLFEILTNNGKPTSIKNIEIKDNKSISFDVLYVLESTIYNEKENDYETIYEDGFKNVIISQIEDKEDYLKYTLITIESGYRIEDNKDNIIPINKCSYSETTFVDNWDYISTKTLSISTKNYDIVISLIDDDSCLKLDIKDK